MRAHQRARASSCGSESTGRSRSCADVSTFTGVPASSSTILSVFEPTLRPMMGATAWSSSSGVKTRHSSGVMVPFTTFSPSPHAPVTTMRLRKPVSVSRVKATPDAPTSERTMSCTPTESATLRCS